MIIDDDVAESPESLSIELVYSPFLPPPSGVILDPNVTTVEILDNDGMLHITAIWKFHYNYIEFERSNGKRIAYRHVLHSLQLLSHLRSMTL